MSKYTDYVYALSSIPPRFRAESDEDNGNYWSYVDGEVPTEFGMVTAEAYNEKLSNGNGFQGSYLRMVHAGSVYERRYDRAYSTRYLVTLAKRFAREVAEGETRP